MRLIAALCLILAASAAPAAAVLPIQRVESPGGIVAWLVEDRSVPLVSMEFGFRGGGGADPEDLPGLTRFAASLIGQGAGDDDREAFQLQLEEVAARFSFSGGLESFGGGFRWLSANHGASADLLARALAAPRFDAADVARVRGQLVAQIGREREDPGAIAMRAWYRAAFPGHPYARGSRGTIDGIARVTADDLRAWAARHLVRTNLTVGVAGDIDAATLGPLLDRMFGALPAGDRVAAIAPVTPMATQDLMVIDRASPQSVVVFGHGGMGRDDPDRYAATLVNWVLGGGGFNARLTQEVRERRGLAYSVYSYLTVHDGAGLMLGGVSTENARVAESLAVIQAEWRRFASEGPTPEELDLARRSVTGGYALRLDSTGRVAAFLLGAQQDGREIADVQERNARIERVTHADAVRVARRLLDPDRLMVVVVGRPTGLQPTRTLPADG
jgi:zinc protease